MAERGLRGAVPIIEGRLSWVSLAGSMPSGGAKAHFFSVDDELTYEHFFADFGPLNLGRVYRYCAKVTALLADPAHAKKVIYHVTSEHPHKRANAACLAGCFAVACLGMPAEDAYRPFLGLYPPFAPFRDAAFGLCTYTLTVLDCLRAVDKACKFDFFNFTR